MVLKSFRRQIIMFDWIFLLISSISSQKYLVMILPQTEVIHHTKYDFAAVIDQELILHIFYRAIKNSSRIFSMRVRWKTRKMNLKPVMACEDTSNSYRSKPKSH
jgi:hypothetical protein